MIVSVAPERGVTERGAQTEETALYPRLPAALAHSGLQLDARRLRALGARMPSLPPSAHAPPPPVAVAVAIVGAELPL